MKRALALTIGIAGGSGSGKSWLAAFLKEKLGTHATLLVQDWYYRDRSAVAHSRKKQLNFDHPSAIESALFARHLDLLRSGQPAETPRYDYASHRRHLAPVRVDPAPVVIVEGLFVLHHQHLAAQLDLSVFVDVPADVRLLRRIRRDDTDRAIGLRETLRLYERFVRPMHERFVQPAASRAQRVWRPLEQPAFPRNLVREVKTLLA